MTANPWFSRSAAETPVAVPQPRTAPDEAPAAGESAPPPAVGGPSDSFPASGGDGVAVGAVDAGAAGPLVAFAVGRLAQGRRPDQAFCDLVEVGTERRLAAIAVCVANGTPWDVAEARMVTYDDIWTNLGSGSAETAGGLLELYGYFDREVELTPDESAIATALRGAMGAVEYLPSGYANQLYRMLRTGRLREALFSLEEVGAQRWPDREQFWLHLTDAAVRLDSATILDTEVAALRRRCESRLRR